MNVVSFVTPLLSFIATLAVVTNSIGFGAVSFPTGTPGIAAAVILIFAIRYTGLDLRPTMLFVCVGLLSLFATDLFRSNYSLIPFNRALPELSALILVYLGLNKFRKITLWALTIGSPLFLLYCLLDTCNGSTLFSDDHATFLYRLQMLKENFPFIPFYNPLWNAGIDERYFFATGTLNIFFLASPLVYLLDLWKYYTLVPAFILFGIAPGAAYAATRLTGGTNRAAAISSVLSISTSLGWYQWGVFFGPLGYLTTTTLTPLLASFAARIFDEGHTLSLIETLCIVCTATLVLFWSPGGLMFLPAFVLGLIFFKRTISKKYIPSILALLVTINLPWILVFWSASNVGSFLQKSENIRKVSVVTGESASVHHHTDFDRNAIKGNTPETSLSRQVFEHLEKSRRLLNRNFQSANPLLLFLALPALLLFPIRYRLFYFMMSTWLLILGSIIAPLKDQLELDRMLVTLCLLLTVPIGHMLDSFFEKFERNKPALLDSLVSACILSFLTLGVMGAGAILRNRTPVRYSTVTPLVGALARELDTYTNSGRALFTGFVLHDLDGGHLAPLTTRTSTPLIASSQVHKHWKYTDVIPSEFLGRGAGPIEEYFSLMNVAVVVSTERTWRSYLLSHPELYRKVWQRNNFFIFERIAHTPTYFLKGTGKVLSQSSNGATLTLDSSSAIIKFNYFPFLRADKCKIEPERVTSSVTLIKLSQCPIGKSIRLESKPAYVRISS